MADMSAQSRQFTPNGASHQSGRFPIQSYADKTARVTALVRNRTTEEQLQALAHVLGGPKPENSHEFLDVLETVRKEMFAVQLNLHRVPNFVVLVAANQPETAIEAFERELIDALIAELPTNYRMALEEEKNRLEMLYAWPGFRCAEEIAAGLCASVHSLYGPDAIPSDALVSQDRVEAARAAAEITRGSERWTSRKVVALLLYAWGETVRDLHSAFGNEVSDLPALSKLFDRVKSKTVKPGTLPIDFNNAVRGRLVSLLPWKLRQEYRSIVKFDTSYDLKKRTVCTWLHGAAAILDRSYEF